MEHGFLVHLFELDEVHGLEDDITIDEVPAGDMLKPDVRNILGCLEEFCLVLEVVIPPLRCHGHTHDLVDACRGRQHFGIACCCRIYRGS